MIWFRGQVQAEATVTISVLDRTFEHGLGLFETLRTWNRRAVLLERHLERLTTSAKALGLPLEARDLPGHEAVRHLLDAASPDEDAVLRVTVTGGGGDGSPCLVWMTWKPLPPPTSPDGAVIGYGYLRIDENDPLASHKTLNYWARRIGWERSRASGADERLTFTPDGRLWEGTRTNLFLVRGGALWTPTLNGPVLPGVMRALVLERAATLDLEVHTVELNLATIEHADEVFLTSSVRGIIPVGKVFGRSLDVPGPLTRRLRADLNRCLDHGEVGP